jgi:hypothetical protein
MWFVPTGQGWPGQAKRHLVLSMLSPKEHGHAGFGGKRCGAERRLLLQQLFQGLGQTVNLLVGVIEMGTYSDQTMGTNKGLGC